MDSLDHLRAEDTAAFDHVVEQGLHFPEIREAVRGGAPVSVEHLRAMALRARAEIAATAADEYLAYLRTRTGATPQEPPVSPPDEPSPRGFGGGLAGALGVLVPTLGAVAAVAFLLIGYGLRLAGTQEHLADGLVTAGWTTAVVAAAAAAAAVTALLVTAARQRPAPEDEAAPEAETEVTRSREAWQQALLERGVLPFLHSALRENRHSP
ncbi:hypothetical protein ACFY1P_21635 [Streptomyces sp. NPDC001407]|uniref:hypothetical protein n=1 Tax=unclassified Streptomyces TaxID=2593676 RepID=UPI003411837E